AAPVSPASDIAPAIGAGRALLIWPDIDSAAGPLHRAALARIALLPMMAAKDIRRDMPWALLWLPTR
ncbi:MAG: hypothetical protein ACK4S5_08980, partial [Sphingobium yanoikuyae]